MEDLCITVDDGILDSGSFGDDDIVADDGVGDLDTFADLDMTSDDGVGNLAFDDGAVGDVAVGDIASETVLDRRSIIGSGMDRPIFLEQGVGNLAVKKFKGILKIMRKGIEVPDISFELAGSDHDGRSKILQAIGDVEEAGGGSCIFDEGLKHRVIQDDATQRDVSAILVTEVCFHAVDLSSRGDAKLACTKEMFLQATVDMGIEHGDSIAAGDMIFDQLVEVDLIDEVRHGDDDIVRMAVLEESLVLDKVGNIGIVCRIGNHRLIIEDFQGTTLGVGDPGSSVSDMLGQGTDMVLAEDADVEDAGIEEVAEVEINEGETA